MKNRLAKLMCMIFLLTFLASCTEDAVTPLEGPRDPASGQATGK